MAYQTPYFVIDENQLTKDFQMLKSSLETSWGNYRIGYSFKTNSLPWLVTFLKAGGVMAEVVSDDEYSLAGALGFSDSEIVYNGPVKKRPSFERVLLAGGMEKMCPGQTTMGEAGGRFGFSYENGTFAAVLERVQRIPNVEVTGLHLHSSSKSRSVAVFEAIASMACKLKREFSLNLSYVDLGGGYCGGLEGRPQYPDYFPAVAKVLQEEFTPEKTMLVVEPGISLLSKASTFVTGVVDVRDIGNERYLITDGSRFNIDPTMIKSSHLFHLELNEANPGAEQRKTMAHQCVSGYSCMEVDRIFEYRDGIELMEGDRIVYENVGGYTMSLNPLFIQYFPDVYIRRDGKLYKIRNRWTPKEYMQNSMLYGEEQK